MTSSTAFLYVEGFESEVVRVIQYQLGVIGRIQNTNSQLNHLWQITSDKQQAHAYCLGKDHQCGDLTTLNGPILLEGNTQATGLTYRIKMPITILALIDAFKWVEDNVGDVVPKPALDTRVADSVDNAIASIATQAKQEFSTSSNTISDKISFADYLARYPMQERKHLLTWDNGVQVLIDSANGVVISNCAQQTELVKLLLSSELAQCSSGSLNGTSFSYDAVMWSVGLRGQINSDFITTHDVDTCAIRLKKWPLFGRWETAPSLLMLTTLFTQKFISVHEASIRSGLTKEQVLHFLYAAEQARLPMDYQQTEKDKPIEVKKSLAWINELRNKLRMNETVAS
ncbi:MAG: hypothetical protein IJR46_05265 [Neisseriaceae bacterium]|nr:hypothetical protein [Neisseriaceae bacterium]